MEVKVTSGHVVLDFTQAVITQPTLALDVDVRSGAVKLMTRPGIVVDAERRDHPQRRRQGEGAVGVPRSRSSCTSWSPAGWAAGTSSRGRGTGTSGSG